MEEKTCKGCKFKTPDQIQGHGECWGYCLLIEKLNKELKLNDVCLAIKIDRDVCCFSNAISVNYMLESDCQFTAEDYAKYITDKRTKNKVLGIKEEPTISTINQFYAVMCEIIDNVYKKEQKK